MALRRKENNEKLYNFSKNVLKLAQERKNLVNSHRKTTGLANLTVREEIVQTCFLLP